MKVNEIRYERVTLEETKEKIAAAVDAVRGAKSGKDLAEIREKRRIRGTRSTRPKWIITTRSGR